MADTPVAVILSTYNGERFLDAQLDSIMAQRGVTPIVFARDDGSRDGTRKILARREEAHPGIRFINRDSSENLGIRDSFLAALRHARDAEPEMQWFAFADQDDVWLPDKLAAGVGMLAEIQGPALYYGNKRFVDQDLNPIRDEHIRFYNDVYEAFWANLASGCTMVFNRHLAELALRETPADNVYHDAFIYRLAKAAGAGIRFDEKPHILYRQHGDNDVGMEGCTVVQYRWYRAFLRRDHPIQRSIREIAELYADAMSPDAARYYRWMAAYPRSLSARLHLAADPMALRRGPKLYVMWVLKLFFGTL